MAKEVPASVVAEEVEVVDEDFAEFAAESLEIAEATLEIFAEVEPEPEVVEVLEPVANPVRVKAGNLMPMARSQRRP